jgi:hypothetical protein
MSKIALSILVHIYFVASAYICVWALTQPDAQNPQSTHFNDSMSDFKDFKSLFSNTAKNT